MVPILNAIFVAPLYDILKLSNFAGDNFALSNNKNKLACVNSKESTLNGIVQWVKDSGLKINEAITEMCLLHRKDTSQVEIAVCYIIVNLKDHMNLAGV